MRGWKDRWSRRTALLGSLIADDAYRFIEQVMAKLAPSDAAFLVHPSKFIVIPFDGDLRGRLARAELILPNP